MTEYVRTWESENSYIESLGGVQWHEAPLPPWQHECRAQTRGWLGLTDVRRCPCGAYRVNGAPWREVNQTRIGRGEQPPRPRRRWFRRSR